MYISRMQQLHTQLTADVQPAWAVNLKLVRYIRAGTDLGGRCYLSLHATCLSIIDFKVAVHGKEMNTSTYEPTPAYMLWSYEWPALTKSCQCLSNSSLLLYTCCQINQNISNLHKVISQKELYLPLKCLVTCVQSYDQIMIS